MTTARTPPSEAAKRRVREALEREVARVNTPEAAGAVMEQIERCTEGRTEQQAGQAAAGTTAAAATIERSARVAEAAGAASGSPTGGAAGAAAALTEAAAVAAAPTSEAPAVAEAAQLALTSAPDVAPWPVQEGRRLLKQAVLSRMGRLQRLDAWLFLAVNSFPHSRWSDRLADSTTTWTNGGWIWAFATLVASLARVPGAGRALALLVPSMVTATWVVEHPVKAFFRRRRPFIENVRALVIGKKPGGWSFPSGHTASSFACAWVLSTVWPRSAPFFFALASCVGFSRIYVGAHYPGDVTSGALFGLAISEFVRRVTCTIALRRARQHG